MMILHFLCRLEQTIFYMKQEIEQKELGMGNFQGYPSLLRQIKHRVSFAQQKAMYAANEELLRMNWDIGEMLTKSQEADGWGKKTLQRLAVDLKNEYPERKGFSVRNMQCMMQFYNEYNKELTMAKVGNIPITQSYDCAIRKRPDRTTYQALILDSQYNSHTASKKYSSKILVHDTMHYRALADKILNRSHQARLLWQTWRSRQ